jgi:site-specific recombinase XerD
MRNISSRYDKGEISRHYCYSLIRNAERLVEYAETGVISRDNPSKGSHYTLTSEFEDLANGFLASEEFHPNTRNDMRWVTHKYFAWLTKLDFVDLSGVGAEQLQKFLIDCSKQLSLNSMHNVKLYLKKLYLYLYENKLSESPFTSLLSFRVNRETKIFPCLPQDDIGNMLKAINRNTPSGKRAYAVMMLGAELGIRACDVINMKLTDIDWINGEIKILQSKTGKTVILPLTADVGESLRDYILYGRQNAASRHIFVRLTPPHTPLKSAITIGEIYRDCCTAAGIKINKRFHNLRRSLGTAMVTSGVSVETAAQVFGDIRMDSMKQYISLDTKHLKSCALPFDGIAPIGGEAL